MLGFRLNDEQEGFRLAVRSFAEKALAPRVEELERTETFPRDLFAELGRLGYLGVGYPEAYGGSGGDMVMRCLLIEEIARVNCGFAAALLAHVGAISMFIVDTTTPGFTASRKLRKTGHHTSETAALAFDDMQVPVAALLGGSEGGFQQVTGTLEGGRITHAARSVGVSQAALEAALKYAREREQFGQPIAKFQAIKFKLARMATEVETARTSMWRAAWPFDRGY